MGPARELAQPWMVQVARANWFWKASGSESVPPMRKASRWSSRACSVCVPEPTTTWRKGLSRRDTPTSFNWLLSMSMRNWSVEAQQVVVDQPQGHVTRQLGRRQRQAGHLVARGIVQLHPGVQHGAQVCAAVPGVKERRDASKEEELTEAPVRRKEMEGIPEKVKAFMLSEDRQDSPSFTIAEMARASSTRTLVPTVDLAKPGPHESL
ncbi:hypothetical protein CRUP_012127 [Coryphaenoides rupestris]|nr:hypothetical protein CRUP_012127 [Coryphaenoides rupestris]